MKRTVIIEGVVLIALGLLSVAEAIRLFIDKASEIIQDELGAGSYVLLIGIPLIIVGMVHLFSYRSMPRLEKVTVDKSLRVRMMSIFGVCAIYTFLIGIIGYLSATLLFFFLHFYVVGIKSWRTNIIITLSISLGYYIVFVKYCDMVFPRGIFF